MKLLGENITEFTIYNIEILKKLRDNGRKSQKFDPTEKGLIIAADHALQLEKHTKNLKKPSSIIYHPRNIAIAAASDYMIDIKAGKDSNYVKRILVDKIASASFFLMWDTLNADFFEDYGEDTENWEYHTEMCLDYSFEIITGGEHFKKIGIRVINSKDSNDVEYFDALKLAKEVVDKDLMDMGEVCAVDNDYFVYRFNVALNRLKRVNRDDLKESEPMQKMIKKAIEQKKKEDK